VAKALPGGRIGITWKIFWLLLIQFIEASDLEIETKMSEPVRYHEAWSQLCSSNGVLIPGGFGVRGIEGKILAAEWARKKKIPFLG